MQHECRAARFRYSRLPYFRKVMNKLPKIVLASLAALGACQAPAKSPNTGPDVTTKGTIPAGVLNAALPSDQQVVKGVVVDLEVLAKGSGCKVLMEADGGTIEVLTFDLQAQGVLQTALLKGVPVLVHYRKRGTDGRELTRVKLNSKDIFFRK